MYTIFCSYGVPGIFDKLSTDFNSAAQVLEYLYEHVAYRNVIMVLDHSDMTLMTASRFVVEYKEK